MGSALQGPVRTRMQHHKEFIQRDITGIDLGYEYPTDGSGRELDLRPGSALSEMLIEHVLDKARQSQNVLSRAKEGWKKMDWTLNAYMPPDDKDLDVITADGRKPVTVVIPMTFAAQELYLTYMTNAFLRDGVIHKFTGLGGPEHVIAGAKLERVVQKQSLWWKEGRKLTNCWRDMFRYGFGVVSPQWKKHKARSAVMDTIDELLSMMLKDAGQTFDAGDTVRFFEDQVLFEGSELQNIDPYKILLDPNTPILNIQRSGFVGWMWKDDVMQWVGVEDDPEEHQFNGKYGQIFSEQGQTRSSLWGDDDHGRRKKQNIPNPEFNMDPKHDQSVHNITMLMNIIPRRFGLSDETKPTKYLITISGDKIIRQLHQLKLDHGMFPVAVCAANADGYDVAPVSHLMTTLGMQHMIDWFMKSHVDNVRKAMNDMIIYDPSMIDKDDIMNPGPGKLIRMKQSGYGLNNLDAYVKQLNVTDVTRGHTADLQMIVQLMNQVNGTDSIVRGDLSSLPDRPTATGIQAAQQGSLSRLQMVAGLISMDLMRDVAWQHGYNTIQFMEQDMWVEIAGRHEEVLRSYYGLDQSTNTVPVSPMEMNPSFHVVPHDAHLQQVENTQAMGQLLQTAMSIEGVGGEVFGKLNIPAIFLQYMQRIGFSNVTDFQKIETAVVDDAQVQDQIQRGNLVPSEELGQSLEAV